MENRRVKRSNQGFTLIELLIVVAIIAILAAIAVPNFLEAQTRSKVSRIQADFRTFATAQESYYVDWNTYTDDSYLLGNNQDIWIKGFIALTTPIAYITTPIRDTFNQGYADLGTTKAKFIFPEYGAGSLNIPWNQIGSIKFPNDMWGIFSVGPDGEDNVNRAIDYPYTFSILPYDPTNGTVSAGELMKLGPSDKPHPNAICDLNPFQAGDDFYESFP
jgi:prepilin-type N-terminal cleavage/methylation domain-containing protein